MSGVVLPPASSRLQLVGRIMIKAHAMRNTDMCCEIRHEHAAQEEVRTEQQASEDCAILWAHPVALRRRRPLGPAPSPPTAQSQSASPR